jgi:CRISPR-associated endoribonuclease Cas6
MRLKLIFKSKLGELPSDNRKYFLSFIKKSIENFDKKKLEEYYAAEKMKDFTFSLFFPNVNFKKGKIKYDSENFIMNFSTPNGEESIYFLNSFMGMIGKEYKINNGNSITLANLEMVKEKSVNENSGEFKILSPIIVKKRIEEKNKDWYYFFQDDEWEQVLKENMKFQLKDKFEFDPSYDIEQLKIMAKSPYTRQTVITNYNISYPVTIANIYIEGKKYLLNYILKAGLGSKTSMGYGMIDKIN